VLLLSQKEIIALDCSYSAPVALLTGADISACTAKGWCAEPPSSNHRFVHCQELQKFILIQKE